MKPTPITTRRRRDSFDPAIGQRNRSSITDYSYQSAAFGGSGGSFVRNSARSFWNIGADYLRNEARHDYQREAIFFGLITITTALPLISNVHALIEFMRAITSH
jgi:hypothetical protein